MSFTKDREVYLSIANNSNLTVSEKEEKIAKEFYDREKNFNMSKVEKLARWIEKETNINMSSERLWAILEK